MAFFLFFEEEEKRPKPRFFQKCPFLGDLGVIFFRKSLFFMRFGQFAIQWHFWFFETHQFFQKNEKMTIFKKKRTQPGQGKNTKVTYFLWAWYLLPHSTLKMMRSLQKWKISPKWRFFTKNVLFMNFWPEKCAERFPPPEKSPSNLPWKSKKNGPPLALFLFF